MLPKKNIAVIADLSRSLIFLFLLMLPWLLVRLILGVHLGFETADARGVLSDSILIISIGLLLAFVSKNVISRLVFLIVFIIFFLFSIGNYEHILALDASFSFRDLHYLQDANFLSGSFTLSVVSFVLLGFGLVTIGCIIFFHRKPFRVRAKYLVFCGLALLALFFISGKNNDAKDWRQSNVIIDNLLHEFRLARKPLQPDDSTVSPEARKLWQEISTADLSGEIFHRGTKKNVLIILVEGLSGHFVYRNPGMEKYLDDIHMPKLAQRAESALFYTNFFAPQVQTNRGEYALLCGDLPNIATHAPKMPVTQQIQSHLGRACLPQHLRDNGYLTSYLQAAGLNFMDKDKFMPVAGFERIAGKRWFEKPYLYHAWGVADQDFFKQSLREVDYLRAQEKPWMLTLLTVGTHHPYTIPEESKVDGISKFHNAVQHVDDELDLYLELLKQRGVLEDTLVIITSDESRGSKKDKTQLSKNWTPMIVIDESSQARQVTEPYIQTDLALSVLDYLSLLDDEKALQGRSMFRNYGTNRPLVFGIFHDKKVHYLDESSLLTSCDYSLTECYASQFSDQSIFNQLLLKSSVEPNQENVESLSYIVKQNDWGFERFNQSVEELDGVTPWLGEYFNTWNFKSKRYLRQDTAIDFDWGDKAPIVGFPSVDFSVRWTSCLSVEEEDTYTLNLMADEGARLFVNDEEVIDHWRKMSGKKKSYLREFAPGTYQLRLEYYEGYFQARVSFSIEDEEKVPVKLTQPVMLKPGEFECG